MQRVSTDFPAPLSPHRPVTWPAGRSRLTPYSACTGPKCLSMPLSLSKGSFRGSFRGSAPSPLGLAPAGASFISVILDDPVTRLCLRLGSHGSPYPRTGLTDPPLQGPSIRLGAGRA